MSRNKKVCWIDDSQPILDITTMMFKRCRGDLSFQAFSRFGEAVKHLESDDDVAIVVTDFDLKPESLTGFEVIERLYELNPRLRFIIVSGVAEVVTSLLSDTPHSEEAKRYGSPSETVRDVLRREQVELLQDLPPVLCKPVEMSELFRVIDQLLD